MLVSVQLMKQRREENEHTSKSVSKYHATALWLMCKVLVHNFSPTKEGQSECKTLCIFSDGLLCLHTYCISKTGAFVIITVKHRTKKIPCD